MRRDFNGERSRTTSWQKVAPWYNKLTGRGEGHYYHQRVVIPGVLRLLGLSRNSPNSPTSPKLLDLACGNGVLAKSLPKNVDYTGVDIAESLVKTAKLEDKNYRHAYIVDDITGPLTSLNSLTFSHATIILALQNIANPLAVLKNAANHLAPGGSLIIVLNHPAFRIPRQSSWGIDEPKKLEYRRIDRYMTPLEIPINMNPSDRNSEVTWTYHHPISDYSKMLKDAGFVIELIEEWTSDKESQGKAVKNGKQKSG